MDTYGLYINGAWEEAAGGKTIVSHDPATGEALAEVAAGGEEDIDRAVKAARRAFDEGEWPRLPLRERAAVLRELARRLRAERDRFAELEARDSGSTIRKAKSADIGNSVWTLNVYADLVEQLPAEEPLPHDAFPAPAYHLARREPIGVCGAIVAWNFPLQLAVWKIAPALAAGNTIVVKPAPWTPLTALEFAKLTQDLLPPGVLNVVPGGSEAGRALVQHPGVDKIGFTGSTETGRQIMQMAAGNLKKLTLELGGKSANIVLPDADLELAVDGALYAIFFHAGQACEAGSRLFLPVTLHDEFVARMVDKAKRIKLGLPLDPATDMGPLAHPSRVDIVHGYVEAGLREGATLVTGGARPDDPALARGAYYLPTIFTNVRNDMTIAREEIFGPVLSVIRYREVEEAVAMANDSPYGLAAGVWSRDTGKALEIAQRLRAGTVWVNEWHILHPRYPFGGYKQSGFGRELGLAGYLEYTELKHIHVDLANPRAVRRWFDSVVPRPSATPARAQGG
ncbi:MAG: aldehyde dehydrogenase family protein [Clostridia bacterium]|nr:aldehyde dehydrogenase family protein [Clostridia bacterium]